MGKDRGKRDVYLAFVKFVVVQYFFRPPVLADGTFCQEAKRTKVLPTIPFKFARIK